MQNGDTEMRRVHKAISKSHG